MMVYIGLAAYLLFINVIAFVLFAIDKNRALEHESRIPEAVLLWTARLGGGLGCALGMYGLHHKKKKPKFQMRIPLWITLWMFIVIMFLIFGGDSNIIDDLKTLRS